MSGTSPPKKRNRKTRSDSAASSTGAEPEPPHSPKDTRAKTPVSPSHPPSHTAFPSSIPSTGNSPTKSGSTDDSPGGVKLRPYDIFNMGQTKGSTTASPSTRSDLKIVIPAGPTSAPYGSKPLEPGYATAGLDLTKPSTKGEVTTTRDFKTQTAERVGGGVKVTMEEEKEMSVGETVDYELEQLKRVKKPLMEEALVEDQADVTVEKTVKKAE